MEPRMKSPAVTVPRVVPQELISTRKQDKGLYNLDGSDGEDATAATSKGIYQEPSMTFTSERKQKYGKSSVKDSENKKRTELHHAGESEEEGDSIMKSKIPIYASSTSKTELKFDTKQDKEPYNSGGSDGEDVTDISNERIKSLPTRTTIEEMWSDYISTTMKGESEQNFHSYCREICTFIKTKSDGILNVWPAYATDKANGVCFIVQTKEKLTELSVLDYPLYVRPVSQYSNENKIAMQRKEARDNMLEFKDVKHIQEVLNRHASELFQSHSQLSLISGSGFRSKGYDEHDNSNHQIIPGKTVVMYVKIKGKVPLREKLLPTELEGIPVDVREGGFESAGLNANDVLPNLRMGCEIASTVGVGTLGGFIHHSKYGLCATTCAHVVLSDEELTNSVTKNFGKMTWEDDKKIIWQPNNGSEVGRVTETFFKPSEEGSCGIDLAIFQIEERPPNSGKFPTFQDVDTGMIYESGTMCENTPFLYGRKVRKFGSSSGLTKGVVDFTGTVCRPNHVEIDNNEYHMKVIHISSSDEGDFCSGGDSGALVFQTGVGKDSVCIGMLIGSHSGNGIAIHISEVKERLGISEFESFRMSSINDLLNGLYDKNQTKLSK